MAAAKKKAQEEYGAQSITILEGLEAVRKRPSMYIGSTGERGLHHLMWEVVDNAVDEAMAGYASKVDVRMLEDGGVEVSDDGRGIPVDMHASGVPTVDVVMTQLHAGGKFDARLRLCGHRWSARRGRFGGERVVQPPGGGHLARRSRVVAVLRSLGARHPEAG